MSARTAAKWTLIALIAALSLCALAARPAIAEGDAVEIDAPAQPADGEQADEPVGDDGEAKAEPRIQSSADIPPERLIEPAPMGEEKEPLRIVIEPQVIFPVREYHRKLPTLDEWQRVLAALFGGAPPEEPVPAEPEPEPAATPPVKPERPIPAKPPAEPEEPAPAEEPEEALEKPQLTTEEAVGLALRVKAGGLSDDYARVVVNQGRVSGSTKRKKYDIRGKLSLYYKDISASADAGHIDQNAETVSLMESVRLSEPNYNLTCENLNIKFKEKSFVAKTFVRFNKKTRGKEPTDTSLPKRDRVINIFRNEPTEVYSNLLTYNWNTEEMSAIGEVKVVQEKVTATMDRLNYNPEQKTYQMQGGIFITLLETEWVFERKLVEEKDIDLARALTQEETTLEAEYLRTGEDSDVMIMRGEGDAPARITQEDKELSADEITFDDRTKTLTAKGSVAFYQENGDWLREGKLIEGELDEQGRRILENELTSSSENLTFNYDDRILHQWGGVEIVCGDESLVADDLVYNDGTKMLYLTGTVGYFRGDDEYLYADEVTIDTDRNRFEFAGIIESFIYTTDEGRERAKAAPEGGEEGAEGEAEEEAPPPEAGIMTG